MLIATQRKAVETVADQKSNEEKKGKEENTTKGWKG